MSRLTALLARFVGLFFVAVVAAFLVRGGTIVEATVADAPVMLAYAIIGLAIGFAMILGHNVWSGGALPVVVTLVGWLIFAKSLLLLFPAPESLVRLLARIQYDEHSTLYVMPALVIGICCAWAGFATAMPDKS
jgi:hypothetical protein